MQKQIKDNSNNMSRKKPDRFKVVMLLIIGFMCINLAAVAAILPALMKYRANEFVPASAKIAIAENDGDLQEASKNELVLEETDDGGYRADKKVQITNLKTDEYVKVCLVPQWYDSQGRLCGGLGEFSDFGIADPPDTAANTQSHRSSQNKAFVLLTYDLAPDWSDHWRYDGDTGFYFYKTPLKKGETTEPLILGVKIPKEVYSNNTDYVLRVDVLSESIQTTASAESIRAFGFNG